ncbi:putative aldouronate transport system substrate-binding protein [Paenibacillus rhizosphaerae]|uniref:Putative aldouronate transport system substrate-binding protein n=1 Tax=Paenibacillus rhizosphaerae TaxID=297318 RepID=A0A839TUT9_9BACL|nr:extracellular solute-binding protein [Paenibacillus rhizosphaerae]MBB3128447.1 putative aldouronate transport system substrate-binding protein [Paenibacillus rhizosphaerae]
MANLKKTGILLIILVLVLTAACSKSGGSDEAAGGKDTAATTNDGSNTAGTTNNASPKTAEGDKYDPPITVSTVRDQDPSMSFKPGEDISNNAWIKAYQDELGINVKYDWVVPSDQYDAKMNIAISSNQLPDIFRVSASQLKQLVQAGKIADLSEVYENYATELTRQSIELGPLAKAAATFDGKLMALPPDEGGYEGSLPLLWLRSDWLTKLKLEAPKTWDDLEKVMDAFVNQDPDGNGKKDTFGLALTKDLYGNGVAETTGVFNAFGAFPNIWIEDADGSIVYGSIQPEVKTALAKLQELYKKGYIDPEFGVKDTGKVGEDFANNKVGVEVGALWDSLWPLQDSVSKNPDADWIVTPLVSATGKPVQYTANLDFNSFWVVNKKAEHPEALIKLFNLGNEKMYSGKADPKVFHTEIVDGKEYGHFKEAVIQGAGSNPIGGNFGHYKKVTAALDAKDPSGLNQEQKGYYDKILGYEGGDRTTWGTMRVFGHESSYKVIEDIYQNKDENVKLTKFYGAPTKTMAQKRATLDKMQLETFTKIILGSSIDEFDKFVDNWKKLGGDQMTKEVNDWYAEQKK